MYPACIPHVSCISDTSLSGCIFEIHVSHHRDFVSWCKIFMVFRDAQSQRYMDPEFLMYLDMYPR
jgi:hypothetical protein